MSILVYVDHFDGCAKPASWEIMGKAREFGDALGTDVVGVLVGLGLDGLAEDAVRYGANRVLTVDNPTVAQFKAHAYAAALKTAIIEIEPDIILLPATAGARDVAALSACELGIGLASDCQGLDLGDDGSLLAHRPVFGGNILTTISFKWRPQMATVRARSFPLPESDKTRTGHIVPLSVDLTEAAAQEEILGCEITQNGELSVENAGIIVAGGRGVKGPEGFAPLRSLARTLGGALGASRAAVDAGWLPYPHQIGQTGKTVRPELYVACGISGAIQHLAGITNARVIVGINTDRDAPIFSVARYGIVGDLFEVIPSLDLALKARMGR
jgi:electron transfer flavoprotein alpha subunit